MTKIKVTKWDEKQYVLLGRSLRSQSWYPLLVCFGLNGQLEIRPFCPLLVCVGFYGQLMIQPLYHFLSALMALKFSILMTQPLLLPIDVRNWNKTDDERHKMFFHYSKWYLEKGKNCRKVNITLVEPIWSYSFTLSELFSTDIWKDQETLVK